MGLVSGVDLVTICLPQKQVERQRMFLFVNKKGGMRWKAIRSLASWAVADKWPAGGNQSDLKSDKGRDATSLMGHIGVRLGSQAG